MRNNRCFRLLKRQQAEIVIVSNSFFLPTLLLKRAYGIWSKDRPLCLCAWMFVVVGVQEPLATRFAKPTSSN